MESADARGSEKLLAALIQKGSAATPDEVKEALAIPAASDYRLVRYFPRGIPPYYFQLEAALEVPQTKVAEAVTHLAANSAIQTINVLMRGIPPVIKTAEITAVLAGKA